MSFPRALAAGQRVAEVKAPVSGWDWELDTPAEFYRFAGEFLFESGDLQALPSVAEGLSEVGETPRPTGPVVSSPSRASRSTRVRPVASPPPCNSQAGTRPGQTRRWSPPGRSAGLPSTSEARRHRPRRVLQGHARPRAVRGSEAACRHLRGRGLSRRVTSQPGEESIQLGFADNPDESAEAWAHYGELLEDALVRGAEEAFSRAMSLDPSLSSTLESRWYTAGEQDVRNGGSTLASLIDQAARQGTALPSGAYGATIQTRIAQDHLAGGRHAFAIEAARTALENYPGLVAPLDVIIGAKLAKQGRYAVVTDILRRIEMAGVDERVERLLDQIDAEHLDGEDLLRAIHASPERFGRAAAARWHMANGEAEAASGSSIMTPRRQGPAPLRAPAGRVRLHEQALSALDDLDGPRGPARERTRSARALLGLGRLGATCIVGSWTTIPAGRAPVFLSAIDEPSTPERCAPRSASRTVDRRPRRGRRVLQAQGPPRPRPERRPWGRRGEGVHPARGALPDRRHARDRGDPPGRLRARLDRASAAGGQHRAIELPARRLSGDGPPAPRRAARGRGAFRGRGPVGQPPGPLLGAARHGRDDSRLG